METSSQNPIKENSPHAEDRLTGGLRANDYLNGKRCPRLGADLPRYVTLDELYERYRSFNSSIPCTFVEYWETVKDFGNLIIY